MTGESPKVAIAARLGEASRLLDRVLYALKQPLSQIRVIAQEVRIDARKGRLEQATVPDSMRELESAVDEMVTMLDQVRSFAQHPKDPAGVFRAPRATAPTDLNLLVRELVQALRPRLPGLEVHSPDPLRVRLPRPGLLERALVELLDNGRLAMEEAGSPHGELTLSLAPRDGGALATVRDCGVGVPLEDAPRIFDPFFTTRMGAAGLGLALVDTLMREMGGSVTLGLESDLGAASSCGCPRKMPPRRGSDHGQGFAHRGWTGR